ncbi:MAG TPA: excinuclease ABC subunit UvrA [Phycisphaerae bacterium]
MADERKVIRIEGARQHNLRNVTLEIPRGRLTVLTGLSGSGKSSLAFDTLYAEGQRKYVESLSAHARQFLEQMPKPDVDRIEGLTPTVAIEQRSTTSNPRSTVATTTEIYDFLRLLFARLGQPRCWICGRAITRQSIAQIVDTVLSWPEGRRFMVLAPISDALGGRASRRAGSAGASPSPAGAAASPADAAPGGAAPALAGATPGEALVRVARQGFVRARINGEVFSLEDAGALRTLQQTRRGKHPIIDVVVDRASVKPHIGTRLADSLNIAAGLSGSRVIIAAENGDPGHAAPAEGGSAAARPGSLREPRRVPDDGVADPTHATRRFTDHVFSLELSCPLHPQVQLPELSPRLFSFNSPHGACPACNGLGRVLEFDPELIVPDPDVPLGEGAISAWRHSGKRMNALYAAALQSFCAHFGISPRIPFRNLPVEAANILMQGTTAAVQNRDCKGALPDPSAESQAFEFEGVIPNLKRRWSNTDSESVKQRLHAFLSESPCEQCHGARLNPEALAVTVGDRNIAEICRLNVQDARTFFENLAFAGDRQVVAEPILREIRRRLKFMCDVGVEYLSLDRPSGTLSGGEAQRIRLATQVGSGLVGVCYVLDEPTIGLHQRDSRRLVNTLRELVALDNTVIVVEHDEDVIAAAEHVVDIGPGAGTHGGDIVAQGTLADIRSCEASITGKYLSGKFSIPVPEERRPINLANSVEIRGARQNNLKNIDVRFPLGCFVCVTGVSGSGKSTLVSQILLRALKRRLFGSGEKPGAFDRIVGASRVDRVIEIDQSPIGRTPRSNPATYVGVFDLIRQLYAKTREAKIRGYSPGRFSFNVKGGRCEECQGQGTKRIEMHFLPDVFVTCSACKGTRYNRETLEIRYRGKSIADVLDMRVEDAAVFFDNFSKIKQLLRSLIDVGLGYVTLGQSSTTLSGGEAQRVKLAAELGKSPTGHTLYILDEPTTGLHFADIHNLLNVLNRLAALGHTIITIEHNLDVIKMADWVIDLGPEGGEAGGYIVAEGRPEEIAANPNSYTGQFLATRLSTNESDRALRERRVVR